MTTGATAAISRARIDWLAAHVLPHEPALRAWLAARTGSAADIDDIVQDVYAVLAGLESVAHIREPRAYLFTTAQSLVMQQLRRARVVPIEAVADVERLRLLSDEHTPERHASASEDLRRLRALIARLPDKCREAFVLRRIDGLSQREIAQRMGVSENTVEKHVGKALRLLTEAMGRGTATGRGIENTPEHDDNDVDGHWQRR